MPERDYVIVAENLTKRFGEKTVVSNVSFKVQRGQIFGFLGPNGSGKSTVIKMLCGLWDVTEGHTYIEGIDTQVSPEQIHKKIGYLSQKFGLYPDLTVRQNLNFYGGIYGVNVDKLEQRIAEVCTHMGLNPYLDQKADTLSGGWKQRLGIASAILHEPTVLFLDEPTAGIDPVARREVWDLLFEMSAEGITLFVTTHYMDEAERCHEVGYIYMSELIALGSVDELVDLPGLYPEDCLQITVLGEPIMELYSYLGDMPEIRQVTIFGKSLHCLLDRNVTPEELKARISKNTSCHNPIVAESKPSLEDVFVQLTKKSAAERSEP